ncbi:MAG: oligoendopeptidase F [Oscillospiraceae bacterium]|nr:oligoendopeptidase F [Oscillospiraceae bacterium]
MAETGKILERSQVAEQDKWAIHDIYATDELWEEDLKKAKELLPTIAAFAGKLGENGQTLLDYLKLEEEIAVLADALGNYAMRRSDEDARVSKYQAMVGKVMSAYVELNAASSFATPEIMEISDETMEQFYAACPGLEKYRRYLDDIRRRRAHVLSPAEEKILAAAGEMANAPDTIYGMFNDADITFPDAVDSEGKKHPLSQGTYISYMESEDRVLRKSAFENLYRTYGAYKNTIAAVLSAQVKQLQFYAQTRKYGSSLEASLDNTNVPTAVYTNLIEAVHRNMDKMYRYVDLRKKLLGVDELHMYDIYTPLVAGVDKKSSIAEAKELVYDALAPLGEDYRAILKEGFEKRWIDVYENAGKRSGAYSAGARVHPFVLLNYTGTLDSQFTLAHEMGHALHSYLSNKHQEPLDADYVIFVAEVASTCNEALLMEHLLGKTTDKKERAYLINHFLDQFRTTLYRQTMFAEFELNIGRMAQEGTSLTPDVLNAEYRRLNRLYFGEDIVLDDEIDMEWMRIPHFYYNYYVFQYATGYAAAIALSRRILKEGESAVKDYIGFLSGGCSKSPIDLLKGAGVDMSTTAPVEEALALFGELIEEMEALMQD